MPNSPTPPRDGRSRPIYSHIKRVSRGRSKSRPRGRWRKLFGQDPEGGTASVVCEVDTTKLGYLTFDPGGMSTINCRKIGGQVSEYSISPRSPLRIRLAHQLYQSQRSPVKYLLAHQDWDSLILQGDPIVWLNLTSQMSIYMNPRPYPV